MTHHEQGGLRSLAPGAEALLVTVVIAALVFTRSLSDVLQVGAFNDDGVYASLGKAIAEGRGYVSIHLVGHPVQPKFPPVFPLIMALLWRVSGSIQGVQHLVSLLHPVVVGSTAGLLWWIGRVHLAAERSLLALFVLTPFVLDAAVQYYTIPLSEPWFMLFWAAALACWTQARARAGRSQLAWLAASGLTVAVTVLARSQGIVLVPAVLIGLFAVRFPNRGRILAVAGMLIPLAAWHFYHAAIVARGPQSGLPDDVTYATWFGGGNGLTGLLGRSVKLNVIEYVAQLGGYLSGAPIVASVLAAFILAAMILGPLAILRSRPVLAISALGALATVAIWPFAQDRLLLSVLPFCGLSLAAAGSIPVARWSSRTRRALLFGSMGCLALTFARQLTIRRESIEAFSSSTAPAGFSASYMLLVNSRFIAQASNWIRQNTTPGDRVLVDNHSGIFLYTGRATEPANPAENRMQRSVFERPGQYLATRILRDSITYAIVGVASEGIMRDIAAIRTRCPGVLIAVGEDHQNAPPIMRVKRDERCLAPLAMSE